MRHGVFIVTILSVFFIGGFRASVEKDVPRGPYFSLGPIAGFSFTKTPRSRDVDDKGVGATRYDKVGHSFNGGFIGNVFYKLSKERVIGLQLCISSTKLKDMNVPKGISQYSSSSVNTEAEEAEGWQAETSSEVPDDTEYTEDSDTSGELINNAKLKYTDLLVVFKYDITWTRTAISCGIGISRCNCSPSNRGMKTNLGYVINGSIDYNINKNVHFMTGVRLRHHAKKEKFDPKKSSSLNNFNIETGLIMSF